ncbi:acyl-CoA dehydrogenase [Gammaproteobacteria bacterium 45_16_T64]|nr:acyl-CoA dehydrogenase [Gammaproteobacteria bacterium 45_16_T64]
MSEPLLNRRDVQFQLYEVLNCADLPLRSRFSEHSKDTFDAAIDTAEQLAEDLFAPHNHLADQQEPTFDGKKVSMLSDVKIACDALAEAGFIAGRQDYDLGGMQLPESIMSICMGYFTAANPSTSGYPFLTSAAANLIRVFASDGLKNQFLAPMLAGRFSGTMALTEPHAGSSLADIRTSATPTENGHYLVKGSKLFISGGEHELTDNIVHLVLAKIKGAPAGVKGISLFLVPKFTLNDNGEPATKNDVALAGLIHKLGYRGTTSTALTFGENNECVGYLIGEPHQGLRYMFQMMNEARIGVAMGAIMIATRGYRYSLAYAQDREQGRHPSNTVPDSPAVNIIEHADVRRMLLAQKAYSEGGLALCLLGSSLLDDANTLENKDDANKALTLLDLLTPIIKSWSSEFGTKSNDLAIQVLGGAGYTREYPVEQFWRDNRLNPIHEGTNGIQALDLLGRKVWQHNSQGLLLLSSRIHATIQHANSEKSKHWGDALNRALQLVQQVTQQLGNDMTTLGADRTLSNASCYLNILGKITVAWLWLQQTIAAEKGLSTEQSPQESAFYAGKIHTAKYFFNWELPTIYQDAKILTDQDDTCFSMQNEWF